MEGQIGSVFQTYRLATSGYIVADVRFDNGEFYTYFPDELLALRESVPTAHSGEFSKYADEDTWLPEPCLSDDVDAWLDYCADCQDRLDFEYELERNPSGWLDESE